jgi:hypothetical protein
MSDAGLSSDVSRCTLSSDSLVTIVFLLFALFTTFLQGALSRLIQTQLKLNVSKVCFFRYKHSHYFSIFYFKKHPGKKTGTLATLL